VVTRLAAIRATVAGFEGPAFDTVTDPYTTPPQSGRYAPDLEAVVVNGRIAGDAAARETRTRAITPAIAAIQRDFRAFDVHALANT
jgi:hypothetical protein